MLKQSKILANPKKLLEFANEVRGNWAKFDSFVWFGKPKDAENWGIVYYSNRDADTLTQCNAKVIEEKLKPFENSGHIRMESHNHWAVGHVDGFSIKPIDEMGNITPVFIEWALIQESLDSYPILNEDLFSEMEWELACETWENMSIKERVELCKECEISIFAARNDCLPQDDNGYLFENLTRC